MLLNEAQANSHLFQIPQRDALSLNEKKFGEKINV